MVRQNQFDVFLAHNSADKPHVRIIANKLKEQGLTTWIDEEQILAGELFQDGIQRAISESKSAAIFIGSTGLGKWQKLELQALISQFAKKGMPVIPVLLPDVDKIPDDLLFLQQFNWVEFVHINDNFAIYKLVQGIKSRDEGHEPPCKLPNPFNPTSGRIDNHSQFFNREKELRDIFELLNAGSGVELLGDRQIGKSSVLKQIEKLAVSELKIKREPIYFNLQEVHTEVEFYEALCEKLGIANCMGYALFKAMKNKRVLLLLDEAEKMTWEGFTRQVREQLRSLAEGENAPLRLVVAARTSLDRLFPDSHDEGMTSPFHGICLRVDLKPWNEVTLRKFVAVRLEPTGVCFNEDDMEKLWQVSQGHPQKLMKACFDLYRQYCPNV